MGDSWDDETYEPPAVTAVNAWGEEQEDVKDDWENALEEESAEGEAKPAPSEDKPAPQKKEKKKKKKPDAEAKPEESDEPELSKEEIERQQRESDMEFFTSTTLKDDAVRLDGDITSLRLKMDTEEEMKESVDMVARALHNSADSKHYADFLSLLFQELCLDLDAETVKEYGKKLSALGAEKLKIEKELDKAKQPKSKKKAAINVAKTKDMFDDFDAEVDAQIDTFDEDFI